jgi:hypothetical protein
LRWTCCHNRVRDAGKCVRSQCVRVSPAGQTPPPPPPPAVKWSEHYPALVLPGSFYFLLVMRKSALLNLLYFLLSFILLSIFISVFVIFFFRVTLTTVCNKYLFYYYIETQCNEQHQYMLCKIGRWGAVGLCGLAEGQLIARHFHCQLPSVTW